VSSVEWHSARALQQLYDTAARPTGSLVLTAGERRVREASCGVIDWAELCWHAAPVLQPFAGSFAGGWEAVCLSFWVCVRSWGRSWGQAWGLLYLFALRWCHTDTTASLRQIHFGFLSAAACKRGHSRVRRGCSRGRSCALCLCLHCV
jgi:hypothetical protein